jgi:hypothetical protein
MRSTTLPTWVLTLSLAACAHDAPPGPSPTPVGPTASSTTTAGATVTSTPTSTSSVVVARVATSTTPTSAADEAAAHAQAQDPVPAAGPRPEQPGVAPERRTTAVASAATPGARDLAALVAPLRQGLTTQPFGKTWSELAHKTPAPADTRGVGGAASVPDLSFDPIEVQAQVQFLEDTRTEVRYGYVSIRVVRQYRYGRLAAAQLVLERIGREASTLADFEADLAALAKAWRDPLKALGLDPERYRTARSDLLPLSKDRPLRVVIEPHQETSP